jgi:hypothetical protein
MRRDIFAIQLQTLSVVGGLQQNRAFPEPNDDAHIGANSLQTGAPRFEALLTPAAQCPDFSTISERYGVRRILPAANSAREKAGVRV